jgi:hypothetical protein
MWSESRNYYGSASGHIITQRPFGVVFYRMLTRVLGRMRDTGPRGRMSTPARAIVRTVR